MSLLISIKLRKVVKMGQSEDRMKSFVTMH